MNHTIELNQRELCLIIAALMAAEDSPDAFRWALRAMEQPPGTDTEVLAIGERLTALAAL